MPGTQSRGEQWEVKHPFRALGLLATPASCTPMVQPPKALVWVTELGWAFGRDVVWESHAGLTLVLLLCHFVVLGQRIYFFLLGFLVIKMRPASGSCAPTKSRRLPSAQPGIWLALDGHSLSTQPPLWESECICPNPQKLTTQAGHENDEWALKKEVFTFHTLKK